MIFRAICVIEDDCKVTTVDTGAEISDETYMYLFLELRFNMASLFSFLQSETTPRVASASNSRLDTSSSSPSNISACQP